MKRCFAFALSCFFLIGCVTNQNQGQTVSRTETPSPLNTSANPWTNVNPHIQAQQRVGRALAR